MKKRNLILFSILSCLAGALVLISLFVPMVHIVGHASGPEKTIVYDKTVSFLTYLFDCPFYLTEASDVYFNATGPIWMATSGILLNLLLGVAGITMFCACIFELATINKDNISIKNNVLAKKISYFVGWFSIIAGAFSIISFIVTTLLSNGYAEFYVNIEPIFIMMLGIAIIILAKFTEKRKTEQVSNKTKNALGFSLTFLFAILSIGLLFVPLYSEYFIGPDYLTISKSTTIAEDLAGDKALIDIPFGLVRFAQFALLIVCAFVLIYSIIGFILTLNNKKTNWLSARVKRWTMTLLIVQTIIFSLVLFQAAAFSSSLYLPAFDEFPKLNMFTWLFYIVLFIPYLPYVFSTMITLNKNKKMQNVDLKKENVNN